KGVLTRLRSALTSQVSGNSAFQTLGQIGFKTERDGTMTIDEAKLDSALASNYSATKSLFVTQPTSTGIAQQITQAVDLLDSVDTGAFTIRKNAITDQITRMTAEIARKETISSQYEERLRLQYASLDGLLQQMQAQTSSLQQLR
ncbi:MAG: flagellar filament capping protein FliD, partial [Nitrospira sp.]